MGRKCRVGTIKDVAKEVHLDWETGKALEKEYMEGQLWRTGCPAPRAIGIDEISIKMGHTYRIVVSDLERHRPIWFGSKDRKEEGFDLFYQWLGPKKSSKFELAIMDMWKAIKESTVNNAPNAAIVYDKFHVIRHLGNALDEVCTKEYRRLSEKDRSFIKWQRLKPYEKFFEMIEKHWDGIAAYSNPKNKISLGFVEGLNNKIRVIQPRSYSLKDEDYLKEI